MSHTLYVTSELMLKHSPKVEYESAQRITAQVRHIAAELLDTRCMGGKHHQPSEASETDLLLAHDQDYLSGLAKIDKFLGTMSAHKPSPHTSKRRGLNPGDRHVYESLREPFAKNKFALNDCEFNKFTYSSARLAAGAVIEACTWVAIAALHARKVLGLERIVIIDWDVHHGDGTEEILLKKGDNGILVFSIHRYGDGFFPGTGEVSSPEVQDNNGWRRIINIPLVPVVEVINGEEECVGSFGNREYLEVFRQAILPIIATVFGGQQPQLILVSSGFDAAEGDALGGFLLTAAGYSAMLSLLCRTAEHGHVVVVTEGGYTPHVNALCASACLRTLLDVSHDTWEHADSRNAFLLNPLELSLFPYIDEGSRARTNESIDKVMGFHMGPNPLSPKNEGHRLEVMMSGLKLHIADNEHKLHGETSLKSSRYTTPTHRATVPRKTRPASTREGDEVEDPRKTLVLHDI